MSKEASMTRLLYVILSQKNLKDTRWDEVANDPILSQEITNGHAARMRFSRFKKQMEGTPTVARRARGLKQEHSMRVEKKPHIKRESSRREVKGVHEMLRPVKLESGLGSSSHASGPLSPMLRKNHTPRAHTLQRRAMMSPSCSPSPTPGPMMTTALAAIKREPGLLNTAEVPQTPTPTSTPTFPNTPLSMSSSFSLQSSPPQLRPYSHQQHQAHGNSSFAYSAPPSNSTSALEDAYGLSHYTMGSISMSPFPLSFSLDHVGERGSAERGNSSERERSLFAQSMAAKDVLGERGAYEMGYPWMGAPGGLGPEWDGNQTESSQPRAVQNQDQSCEEQKCVADLNYGAVTQAEKTQQVIKRRDSEIPTAEFKDASVKVEEKWEQGYR